MLNILGSTVISEFEDGFARAGLFLPGKRGMAVSCTTWSWARMHHKVVGNFGSEVDVRSLYYRHFRFNDTSDVGACTHDRPAK